MILSWQSVLDFEQRQQAAPVAKTYAQLQQIKVVRIGEAVIAGPHKIDQPQNSREYWFHTIASQPWFDPDKEHLIVIPLNTKYRPLGFNLVAIGSLNETVAHPREIFRPLIASAAYSFVLMHNHPSGDATCSEADRRLTQRLKEGAEMLQIAFLDHVIVGRGIDDTYFSFRECGLVG